jgi:hypothetical protein
VHFAGKSPLFAARLAYQVDPIVFSRVPGDQFVGAIGRPIADDNPPDREKGLSDH